MYFKNINFEIIKFQINVLRPLISLPVPDIFFYKTNVSIYVHFYQYLSTSSFLYVHVLCTMSLPSKPSRRCDGYTERVRRIV